MGLKLQRIARRSLSDEVFDQLSSEIVEGRMKPGVTLPSERALCEMLGVNRGAVREGLKRLAQAGLVDIQHGGGTTVLDFRRTGGLDLLSRLMLRGGELDLDVARSVMEMRAALAPDIARLCARRASDTPELLEHLDALVREMEAARDDLPRLQELSLRFWDELVRGSHNIAYELAFNTLRDTYDRLREALVHVMEDEIRDLAAYRSIAKAVARRDDVAAKHVAAALVEHGTHRVLEVLEALRETEATRTIAQRDTEGGAA